MTFLWLASNELSTSEIIPQQGATLGQLDQWVPLAGSIFIVTRTRVVGGRSD